MQLYIKNMVCDRCILVVRQQLDLLKIDYTNIQLGKVEVPHLLNDAQLSGLKQQLHALGFELLDDPKAAIITQVKGAVIKLIHSKELQDYNKKISVLLAEKLGMDYHTVSTLFSSIEGVTIEKYVILQRIERVKELLIYDECNLNNIADELGYSSVQHLSQQFKKITGLTTSQFKQTGGDRRKPLDQV